MCVPIDNTHAYTTPHVYNTHEHTHKTHTHTTPYTYIIHTYTHTYYTHIIIKIIHK